MILEVFFSSWLWNLVFFNMWERFTVYISVVRALHKGAWIKGVRRGLKHSLWSLWIPAQRDCLLLIHTEISSSLADSRLHTTDQCIRNLNFKKIQSGIVLYTEESTKYIAILKQKSLSSQLSNCHIFREKN